MTESDRRWLAPSSEPRPPQYASRLFDAQEREASDEEIQQINARTLKGTFTPRTAAGGLSPDFTDVERLDVER
ncbi:hypothetical protein ABZ721_31885 [Streptomyces sp. NPDC006733]|uniref:hypothetical protein n=1 Tax=Streptomyces sp. NPDC006733 TaxID=3155460 RepID=UPI0033F5935A